MKPWDDLTRVAQDAMHLLGDAGPTVHPQNREIKGYVDDEKTYFSSQDLRELAEGLIEVAAWLDERATSTVSGDSASGVQP